MDSLQFTEQRIRMWLKDNTTKDEFRKLKSYFRKDRKNPSFIPPADMEKCKTMFDFLAELDKRRIINESESNYEELEKAYTAIENHGGADYLAEVRGNKAIREDNIGENEYDDLS
ncbi:uncharacterized protein LOC141903771 isoform X3 [Tubulanus polymorphus]